MANGADGQSAERGAARNRAIRRGGLATVGARGVLAVVSVATVAIASRTLNRPEFGLVATLASLYVVVAYAELGLSGVLMTRLAEARAQGDGLAMRRHATHGLTALGVIGATVGVLGMASVPVLPWSTWLGTRSLPGRETDIAVLLFFLFAGISVVTVIGSSVLVAVQRLASDQTWTAIGGVVSMAMVVCAASFGMPPWAYVVALTAGPGLTAAGRATWALFVEYPEFRPAGFARPSPELWEFVRSSGYLGIINIAAALSIGIDALVIASVKGASAAAVFNVAARLFLLIGTVVGLVGRQIWSALTEAISHGDYLWATTRHRRAVVTVTVLSSVVSGALVAAGRPVSRVWVGAALVPPLSLLIVFAILTIFTTAVSQMLVLLLSQQRLKALAIVGLAQTPLNLLASVLLTHEFGLVGPVLGSLVSSAPLTTLVVVIESRRLLAELRARAQAPGAEPSESAVVRPESRADDWPVDANVSGPEQRAADQRSSSLDGHRRSIPVRRRSREPGRGRVVIGGALALLLLALGFHAGGASLLGVAVLIATVATGVIVRVDLIRAGLIATCGYVFTCAWTGWYLAGHQRPRAIFLLLALLILGLAQLNHVFPRIPWWYLTLPAVVLLDLALSTMFPTSAGYLASRYLEDRASDFGLALSTGISDTGTATRFLLTILGTVLVVCACSLRYSRAPLWIAVAYAAGASLSGLVGFTDNLGVTGLGHALTGIGFASGRPTGFADHPVLMAAGNVYAVAIPLWLVTTQSPRDRLIGWLLLPGLVLGTYASATRGGVICILVSGLLCFAILPQYRRIVPYVAGVAAVLVGLLFIGFPHLGHSLLVDTRLAGNSGNSDVGRAAVLRQGLRDFEHSPIHGIGLHVIDEAHNVFVQGLAAGGLLLLAAFLWVQFGSAVAAYKLLGRHGLAAPLLATVLTGFVFGAFENTFTEPLVYVPVTLVVALVVQERQAESTPNVSPRTRSARPARADTVGADMAV